MLEPWTDPVSEKRRSLLDLHIHPVIVHFPVAFAATALGVALFSIVLPNVFRPTVTAVLKSLILALPVVTIGAIASGILDGTTRFRKPKAPLLRRKIALGIIFLLSSATAAVLTFAVGPLVPWVRIVDAVLLADCFVAAIGLGRIGGKLGAALFPG
jgi:uncharacterized membrane protein